MQPPLPPPRMTAKTTETVVKTEVFETYDVPPPKSVGKPPSLPTAYALPSLFPSVGCNLSENTVMLLICVIALPALALGATSLSEPWSRMVTTDAGSSGIVVWRDVYAFTYMLSSYLNEDSSVTLSYADASDFRAGCSGTGGQVAASIQGAIVIGALGCVLALAHVAVGYSFDQPGRLSGAAVCFHLIACLLMVLACFYWWFSCHAVLIQHAQAIAWSTDVTTISSNLTLTKGFGYNVIGAVLLLLSSAFGASAYTWNH
jgi:hypothetical protein